MELAHLEDVHEASKFVAHKQIIDTTQNNVYLITKYSHTNMVKLWNIACSQKGKPT